MNEKETWRAQVEKPSPLFIHVTEVGGAKCWLRVDDLRAVGPDSMSKAPGHEPGLTHCSFSTGGDYWIKETPEQILDTIARMREWGTMYMEPVESRRLSGSSSEPEAKSSPTSVNYTPPLSDQELGEVRGWVSTFRVVPKPMRAKGDTRILNELIPRLLDEVEALRRERQEKAAARKEGL